MTNKPNLTTARIAGALYLVIIALGLFAEVVVRARIIEPGDAGATAQNILASEGLFRAGVAADLIVFLADVALAILLYQLFKPVSGTLAMLATAFRLTQTAIIGLNLLNMFMALRVVRDEGSTSLALTFLDAHKYGYLLGLTFFGVSTAILAVLAYRSNRFPKALGVVLGLAGFGYVADSFSFFLIPGYDGAASAVLLAPALIAEVWLALWLLTSRSGLRRPERVIAQPAEAPA